jgi:exonuclease VII large subunit
VAVGVNGEISYIAVPEQGLPPPIQPSFFPAQAAAATPAIPPAAAAAVASPSQQALFAESERMKHELTLLQKQISDLNLAHMDNARSAGQVGNGNNAHASQNETEREVLAKELHLIESAIRDREREIKVNHMRIGSTEMAHYHDNKGKSISTTATSGSKKMLTKLI